MAESFAVLLPTAFAYAAVFAGFACGIGEASLAVRLVFVVSMFAMAAAWARETIKRRSAERRLARANSREDQWRTVAMAAEKVVPEVVGRSLDEWFAAHGIGADVEKSREAMDMLGQIAESMIPKVKR